MRIDVDPDHTEPRDFYRLLTAVVVPRPIAWVSTTSPEGVDNLAPHSFFTIACANPPIVQFTSVGSKDTLRNVERTGEFTVNLAPEHLLAEINATSAPFAADVGEFDAVGIAREPSARVRPPRVADSPVALECTLHSTVPLGDSTVVFGRVVHAAVAEDVVDGGHPDIRLLRPLARLGRDEWSAIGTVHAVARPTV